MGLTQGPCGSRTELVKYQSIHASVKFEKQGDEPFSIPCNCYDLYYQINLNQTSKFSESQNVRDGIAESARSNYPLWGIHLILHYNFRTVGLFLIQSIA